MKDQKTKREEANLRQLKRQARGDAGQLARLDGPPYKQATKERAKLKRRLGL